MRKTSLLLCLMMVTVGFAGCLNGNTPVTDEGDPVVLDESPDDWPTYYVATSADLPTCDSTTLGRLYYVEADTNFQACTSTGWTVISIGGTPSGGGLTLNTAPVIYADVWDSDDDYIVEDGDGTYTQHYYLEWNVIDLDGTVTSVGVDVTGDGVIDVTLPDNAGMLIPGLAPEIQGALPAPLESGNTYIRVENAFEMDCSIVTMKTLMLIATDDDGGVTNYPLSVSASGGNYYQSIGVYDHEWFVLMGIPQADQDWLDGTDPNSNCPEPAVFTLEDHVDPITAGESDNLATLTLVSGAPGDIDLDPNNDVSLWTYGIGNWSGWDYFVVTFNGADETNPQPGDTWTISENPNGDPVRGCGVGQPEEFPDACDGMRVRFGVGQGQYVTYSTTIS